MYTFVRQQCAIEQWSNNRATTCSGSRPRRSGPRHRRGPRIGSSGMWCLRMWRLIITYVALSYNYMLLNMRSQNCHYQTPHPETPHPWTPERSRGRGSSACTPRTAPVWSSRPRAGAFGKEQNGVSTNGVTANFMLFDRGTFLGTRVNLL